MSGYETQPKQESRSQSVSEQEVVTPQFSTMISLNSKTTAAAQEHEIDHITEISSKANLVEFIRNPDMKVPIYPLLIPVTGLPGSGRSECLHKAFQIEMGTDFAQHDYITHSMFKVNRKPIELLKAAKSHDNPNIASFHFGMESGLKFNLNRLSFSVNEERLLPKQPLFNASHNSNCDSFLESFINFNASQVIESTRYQSAIRSKAGATSQSFDPSNTGTSQEDSDTTNDLFLKSLIHGIGLISIWDFSIDNKTVRPLLESFSSFECFTRSNLWLFIDLDKDVSNFKLHLPLSGTKRDKDALRWRSRIEYLLRMCHLCKHSNYKDKKRVCTVFAIHNASQDLKYLEESKKSLQEGCKDVGDQIGVAHLIDFDVKLISKDTSRASQLRTTLKNSFSETESNEIPLSWVFLRGALTKHSRYWIAFDELKQMAEDCHIPTDDDGPNSISKFCNFFGSFGSILDVRKIDKAFKYIIIDLKTFFDKCDKFLKGVQTDGKVTPPDEDTKRLLEILAAVGVVVEMPVQIPNNTAYLVPNMRTGTRKTVISQDSIQLVLSASSPYVQKSTQLLNQMKKYLPSMKIEPSLAKWSNSMIVTTQIGHGKPIEILLSYQGDVIELLIQKIEQINDQQLESVVGVLLKAFHDLIHDRFSRIKDVRCHFAVKCLDSNDKGSGVNYHYHKRHILPNSRFCDVCRREKINDQRLIKQWIISLKADSKNNDVPSAMKLNGDLSPNDMVNIIEDLDPTNSKIPIEAVRLFLNRLSNSTSEQDHSSQMWTILSLLCAWERTLDKNDESPRKTLARLLVACGEEFHSLHMDNEEVLKIFCRLAIKIDMQVLTPRKRKFYKKMMTEAAAP